MLMLFCNRCFTCAKLSTS